MKKSKIYIKKKFYLSKFKFGFEQFDVSIIDCNISESMFSTDDSKHHRKDVYFNKSVYFPFIMHSSVLYTQFIIIIFSDLVYH